MASDHRVALACAAVGLAAVSLAAANTLSHNDWQASAFVRMVPKEPLSLVARGNDPDFRFTPKGHYDGVYFYAIALDPLAIGLPNRLIDASAYHYARPGYGWLAWALSGGGRPLAVPWALLLINLLAMPLAAFGASRLSVAFGRTPWGGLFVALHPGLVYAVTVDTSEVLSVALGVLALIAWKEGRIAIAGLLLAALCLTRESLVVIPLGLALWEIVFNRSAPDRNERLAVLIVSPSILALWWLYIYGGYGHWPFEAYPGTLGIGFSHWLASLRTAVRFSEQTELAAQIAAVSVPLIISTMGLLLVASLRALKFRSFLDPVFLLSVLIASTLTQYQVLFPKDLIRTLAVQLLLAVAILAGVTGHPDPTRATRRKRLLGGRVQARAERAVESPP